MKRELTPEEDRLIQAIFEGRPEPTVAQDAEVLFNMISRYSDDGRRSITIPNGDVRPLLRCLRALF